MKDNKKYYDYLIKLRDGGQINMIESPLYLSKEFNLSASEADNIFGSWVDTFRNGENKWDLTNKKKNY